MQNGVQRSPELNPQHRFQIGEHHCTRRRQHHQYENDWKYGVDERLKQVAQYGQHASRQLSEYGIGGAPLLFGAGDGEILCRGIGSNLAGELRQPPSHGVGQCILADDLRIGQAHAGQVIE